MTPNDSIDQRIEDDQTSRKMRRPSRIALTITLASALAFTGGCTDERASRGTDERIEDAQGDYRPASSAGWGDSTGASQATSGSTGYHGGSHYWFHNQGAPHTGAPSAVRPYSPSPTHYTAPVSRGIFGGTARAFSSGGFS